MGIFSRLRDIVQSNLNAMLDKAEDPEKLIKLMIQEMEDTLVEIKASCAGSMATRKKIERELSEAAACAADWEGKATLAVTKGREDLAREALREKKRCSEKVESLGREAVACEAVVEQYKEDIAQLEEKLASAREKHRALTERHKQAQGKRKAQEQIRRSASSDAFARFESFENRIERMESAAELVNHGVKPSVDEEFAALAEDEGIEDELQALKSKINQGE